MSTGCGTGQARPGAVAHGAQARSCSPGRPRAACNPVSEGDPAARCPSPAGWREPLARREGASRCSGRTSSGPRSLGLYHPGGCFSIKLFLISALLFPQLRRSLARSVGDGLRSGAGPEVLGLAPHRDSRGARTPADHARAARSPNEYERTDPCSVRSQPPTELTQKSTGGRRPGSPGTLGDDNTHVRRTRGSKKNFTTL